MNNIYKLICYALFCIVSIALCGSAEAAFLVTLTNGETISADSYKVEDQRIELKMKNGSASFPRSLVASISNSSSTENLIAIPATVEPAGQASLPLAPHVPAAASTPVQPIRDGGAMQLGSGAGTARPPGVDEKEQGELDKDAVEQMDKADQEELKEDQEFMQEDPPEVISGEDAD